MTLRPGLLRSAAAARLLAAALAAGPSASASAKDAGPSPRKDPAPTEKAAQTVDWDEIKKIAEFPKSFRFRTLKAGCAAMGRAREVKAPERTDGSRDGLLEVFTEDIRAYENAVGRAATANGRILGLVQGEDCRDINQAFMRFLDESQLAFGERQRKELAFYPEGSLKWVPLEKSSRPKEAKRLPSRWDETCRRPQPPFPYLKPVVPVAADPEIRKLLASLAEDTEAFEKARLELLEAAAEMLRHEQGFGCREVLEAFEGLAGAHASAFRHRRNEDLSEVASGGLRWEAAPLPSAPALPSPGGQKGLPKE